MTKVVVGNGAIRVQVTGVIQSSNTNTTSKSGYESWRLNDLDVDERRDGTRGSCFLKVEGVISVNVISADVVRR